MYTDVMKESAASIIKVDEYTVQAKLWVIQGSADKAKQMGMV
jgi:hypothetical protein